MSAFQPTVVDRKSRNISLLDDITIAGAGKDAQCVQNDFRFLCFWYQNGENVQQFQPVTWTRLACGLSTPCAVADAIDAVLPVTNTRNSWVTTLLINVHVHTEAESTQRNLQAKYRVCFWDPPSPPERREHAMIWACNGRDDTPCCAESSLRRVQSVASGLHCFPVADHAKA